MKEEDWRGNSNDRLKADTWQGNGNWSNELGFNIHPGGKQWCGGAFQDFKQAGLYWTSTMNDHRAMVLCNRSSDGSLVVQQLDVSVTSLNVQVCL